MTLNREVKFNMVSILCKRSASWPLARSLPVTRGELGREVVYVEVHWSSPFLCLHLRPQPQGCPFLYLLTPAVSSGSLDDGTGPQVTLGGMEAGTTLS